MLIFVDDKCFLDEGMQDGSGTEAKRGIVDSPD
jgi:hypothetical protein